MKLITGWTVSLAAASALLFAGHVSAQRATGGTAKETRDLTNDPEAVQLLQQIEQKYGQIKTVSGRFNQTRVSPQNDMDEPTIKSSAAFYMVKPNKFRADYDPPRKSTNLINGDYSYQYVDSIKQLNRYKFKGGMNPRDLNYLLLGFGANTNDLLKVYAVKWLTKGVADGYYAIQLVPKDREAAAFKYITIMVTKDDSLRPAQFSMEQLDGVRITVDMNLPQLQIGARINDSIFKPDFDVEPTDIE